MGEGNRIRRVLFFLKCTWFLEFRSSGVGVGGVENGKEFWKKGIWGWFEDVWKVVRIFLLGFDSFWIL